MIDTLESVRTKFVTLMEKHSDMDDRVVVGRPLSALEAIGNPERDDYPILRGKEVLMEAVYRGSKGQAFTSAAGSFRGTLEEVQKLNLELDFERAVFVSTINAVLRNLGLVEGTIHCKDEGPGVCAARLGRWMAEQGVDQVGLVGLQPALLEALIDVLGPKNVLVSDLASPGVVRYQVKVLDGMAPEPIFETCPLVLMTGTSLVNGTIDPLLEMAERHGTRVVFYGTTIAGAAFLQGFERWCACSE